MKYAAQKTDTNFRHENGVVFLRHGGSNHTLDRAARFMDRPDIFRLLGISRNHFYNVTNPDRQTSSGHDYPFPTEWGVKGTNQFHDYEWIKAVCNDCGCICITPEERKELKESNPRKAINVFQKIVGLVIGGKKGSAA